MIPLRAAENDDSGYQRRQRGGANWPRLRGTLLRDGYQGASYQDFNDQVLFGEYSRAINEHAVKMIQTAQVKTGEAVQVYGVFSAWDIPQTMPDITPAKIVRLGGQ